MRSSELKMFFNKLISSSQMKNLIIHEVENYKISLRTKGKSVPIYLIEDEEIIITNVDVSLILNAYIDESFTDFDLYYIIDAMLLSSKMIFDNECIVDLIETFTDPEINGMFTKDKAKEVLMQFTLAPS